MIYVHSIYYVKQVFSCIKLVNFDFSLDCHRSLGSCDVNKNVVAIYSEWMVLSA